MSTKIMAVNLQLGDVITTSLDAPYMHGTVISRDERNQMVTVFRPYIHVSDFTYSSPEKLIPYIGTEEYVIWFSTPVYLLGKATSIQVAKEPL